MPLLKLRRRVNTDPPEVQRARYIDQQIEATFRSLIEQASQLDDPHMKDMWMAAIADFGKNGDFQAMRDVLKWRRPVVDLDEFLFSGAYLNIDRQDVYPGVLEALHDIDSDKYDEVIEKGAIGIGKSFLANLAMARDLYKLSCMRSPQATYGTAKGSPIVFTIQSVRLKTAQTAVFEEFGRFVRNSPYFQQKFRYDPLITSQMVFREHNIRIMPVSSSGSAVISMNVIGGQMDELNFMQKTLKSKSSQADDQGSFDQAKQLYNTLAARRKSRFTHRSNLPGALYLISSSRFPDDFTEIKAAQAESNGGNDPRIYVFEGSQWSVKGRHRFSDEEFEVQIGNETYPSKVLKEGEKPNAGCQVIQVPVDFKMDFERDVEGSIRDMAGMTTLSTHPFFTQREKITEANELAKKYGYLNPLSIEEAEFSIGLPTPNKLFLRTDVKQPRIAHLDLGISKDACGIAIAHLAGHRVELHKNEVTGRVEPLILPVIAYDIVLRVVPPLGGEIQLDSIRKFLRQLNSKYGLNIKWVTTDGFQSVDTRQILSKQGFIPGYTSVEKIEPWNTFRDAIYDGRVLLPLNNFLRKELNEVERTLTNGNKEKVDHRPNGTKDVADAVVGAAAFLFRQRLSWRPPTFDKEGMYMLGNPKRWITIEAGREPLANVSNTPRRDPDTDEMKRSLRKPGINRPTISRRTIVRR